jgi:hypothetical protein
VPTEAHGTATAAVCRPPSTVITATVDTPSPVVLRHHQSLMAEKHVTLHGTLLCFTGSVSTTYGQVCEALRLISASQYLFVISPILQHSVAASVHYRFHIIM